MTGKARGMQPAWDDTEDTLLELAGIDLENGGEVRPTLVAFRGEQPLFLATLRPFAKGAYHDPIIEVGCLAGALDADRLALSVAGRAWSTHDPIPPVLPDGPDLRQRLVILHFVDGADQQLHAWQVIAPFTIHDGAVRWQPTQRMHGAVGWIPSALEVLVAHRHELTATPAHTAQQLARCEALGHQLAWAPPTLPEIHQLLTTTSSPDAKTARRDTPPVGLPRLPDDPCARRRDDELDGGLDTSL